MFLNTLCNIKVLRICITLLNILSNIKVLSFINIKTLSKSNRFINMFLYILSNGKHFILSIIFINIFLNIFLNILYIQLLSVIIYITVYRSINGYGYGQRGDIMNGSINNLMTLLILGFHYFLYLLVMCCLS